MLKLKCPYCNKVSEFEDTGVGWKCPDCTGKVFTQYKDQDGNVHSYDDRERTSQKMIEQTHIYDMDAMDTMVGVTEPGPMFGATFAKLIELADKLDEKDLLKEANIVDKFLQENMKKRKTDPLTQDIKDKTYIKQEFFPKDNIYSLSGEPLANL